MIDKEKDRLRRKLEPDPAHPRYILTKVGIGYLLATQLEVQAGRHESHPYATFL
jgi:Transcriptional regulatory protein, C terminal